MTTYYYSTRTCKKCSNFYWVIALHPDRRGSFCEKCTKSKLRQEKLNAIREDAEQNGNPMMSCSFPGKIVIYT